MTTDREELKEKVRELEDEDMIRKLLNFIKDLKEEKRRDDKKEG